MVSPIDKTIAYYYDDEKSLLFYKIIQHKQQGFSQFIFDIKAVFLEQDLNYIW